MEKMTVTLLRITHWILLTAVGVNPFLDDDGELPTPET